jgi:hypothetical protein
MQPGDTSSSAVLLCWPQVTWFEGGYTEYEQDRRSRMGGSALSPHRLKFRKLAMA